MLCPQVICLLLIFALEVLCIIGCGGSIQVCRIQAQRSLCYQLDQDAVYLDRRYNDDRPGNDA
jgi:cell division protein FtsB